MNWKAKIVYINIQNFSSRYCGPALVTELFGKIKYIPGKQRKSQAALNEITEMPKRQGRNNHWARKPQVFRVRLGDAVL